MSKIKEITVVESSSSDHIIVAESSTSNLLPLADDSYFSAPTNEEEIFPYHMRNMH